MRELLMAQWQRIGQGALIGIWLFGGIVAGQPPVFGAERLVTNPARGVSPVRRAGKGKTGATCFRDWSKAKIVVRKNRLASVDRLSRRALRAGLGRALRVRLCRQSNGQYVYRVILKTKSGRLYHRVTRASAPFKEALRAFGKRRSGPKRKSPRR